MTKPRQLGDILFQDENIKVVVAQGSPCAQRGCPHEQVGLVHYPRQDGGVSVPVEMPLCDLHLRRKVANYTRELRIYKGLQEAGLSPGQADEQMKARLFRGPPSESN